MASIANPVLTFAIVPRVAAFCSIVGSSLIVAEVSLSERKRNRCYHRIMFGMSICDIIASICYFLGRWPLPSDAAFLAGGVGTQETCTAQGFFGQSVLATVSYNAVLSIYYLLVVTFGWREDRLKKYEPLFHSVPLGVWLGTGISGIVLEIFNPAFFNCWIAPYPINCAAYGEIGDDRPPCTRGYLAPIFQWAFFYAPIWAIIFAVSVIMFIVYWSVLKVERKNDRYSIQFTARQDSSIEFCKTDGSIRSASLISRKYSRKVASQGLWYLLPFYITWIFAVATELTEIFTGKYYDPLVVLVSFFVPFQGFLNFIVYKRPLFVQYREIHPDWSLPTTMWSAIVGGLRENEHKKFIVSDHEPRKRASGISSALKRAPSKIYLTDEEVGSAEDASKVSGSCGCDSGDDETDFPVAPF